MEVRLASPEHSMGVFHRLNTIGEKNGVKESILAVASFGLNSAVVVV